ncbi:hypothetical protein BK659_15490 [Pseudomonas brassicacearum]|uniref:Uncharacterized protein n=1 Tax=Pseudomonas brassicacearum TaxID=930166 RepID=A0A423H6K5_9PSED|nr:hypothetical protein [Pseudomonas brassicacearum]RON08769.1 hypothetical protein BK659_15490 [Pseudomonas brassicacearum]
MKIRNSLDESAASAAGDYLLCAAVDEIDRWKLISELKLVIRAQRDRPDNEVIDFRNRDFPLMAESSLGYVHEPVCKMLNDMLRLEQVKAVFAREKVLSHYLPFVTSSGRLEVMGPHGWLDVAEHFHSDPVVGPQLRNLVAAAKETGGEVRSGGGYTGPSQWLRFHGLEVPKDVAQIKNLLSFLEWEWPAPDHLGNYWEQLTGHDDESAVLTTPQYAEIRALTDQFVPKGQSLLDTLYKNVQSTHSGQVDWQNANEIIVQLVNHASSQELAKKYLDALGWYGSAVGETVNENDLAQLLVTAILLELNPLFGVNEKRNSFGTYDIYEPMNSVDRPLFIVRESVERHLVNNQRVSHAMAPLASHLLLAGIAPGFLVKNLPQELLAGSIGWVTFSQAVALVELKSTGASRFMTYEQVMWFASMDSISSSLAQLQGVLAVESIIDWALINEVITHEALTGSAKKAAESAMSAYKLYVKDLAEGVKVFSTPLPNRKEIALAALKEAAPGCDFLEQRVLRHESDRLSHSYKMSMLDLHVEGELASAEWDWREGGRLYDRYPLLEGLSPNQPRFEAQVLEHHGNLHRVMAASIKLAMSHMPSADREIFETHAITFFTVRSSVAELVASSSSSVGLVGVNSRPPTRMESQAKKDEAIGRYGIVMCVSHGNNQILCYEMLTLQGICRVNTHLGNLIQQTERMSMPSRLEFKGNMTDFSPALPVFHPRIDLRSYTHGTEPRTGIISDAVIEKLGTLAAPTSIPEKKRSAYQHFANPHISNIAQFIVTNRPLATVKELTEVATVLTEREQKRATTDKVVTYVVDLVVPFKKCIEDIASGERNRVVDGVFGCIMDGIGIFCTALGVTTKILSIASRTVSLTSKVVSFAKFGLKLTVSVFNPTDGLPSAAYQSSKAVLKSGLQLGREGAQLVEAATSQLRRLTGKAKSVDLLQSANLPHLGQGTWCPRGSTVDALSVCAVSQKNHWYAVNRYGKPWGKRLADFDFKQAFSLPDFSRAMPAGYSRQIIQQSLPIARRKIDNALSVLTTSSLNHETDLAIGLFLGSTTQARDDLLAFLKVLKTDFNGTSASNFILDSAKDNVNIVQVNPFKYYAWKQEDMTGAAEHPFLTINTHNLNNRFSLAGSQYGEIADDLIHEMLRAGPSRVNVVSAKTAIQGNRGLDVAPLLNLAAGRLPRSTSGATVHYHQRGKALINADSYALTTALLSQRETDKPEYLKNIGIINAAIKDSADGPIHGEVLVNLNTN